MTAFHDVQFPLALAQGAKLTLQQAGEIVRLASGREVRNARWSSALRAWDVSGAISSAERIAELIAFFEARRGNVHAFRFRDTSDYSSGEIDPGAEDQLLGTGDGTATNFQLVKHYGDVERSITRPVHGSVRVAVGGVETAEFSVDWLSGEVALFSAPSSGDEIRAGFQFDVPARFEAAQLNITLDACRAGRAPSVKLVEVRER